MENEALPFKTYLRVNMKKFKVLGQHNLMYGVNLSPRPNDLLYNVFKKGPIVMLTSLSISSFEMYYRHLKFSPRRQRKKNVKKHLFFSKKVSSCFCLACLKIVFSTRCCF